MNKDIVNHYDRLIDENNDPFFDPKPLKEYMKKWDGQIFIDKMELNSSKTVLEIGVGTGRLAIQVIPLCAHFYGIDISPKTIERAKINLHNHKNISLICDDFLTYDLKDSFDVIYSSLTFMHFKDKQLAFDRVSSFLADNGRFVLSIDKNQDYYIDMGSSRIRIYPDNPVDTKEYIKNAELKLLKQYETEFAHIFLCTNL